MYLEPVLASTQYQHLDVTFANLSVFCGITWNYTKSVVNRYLPRTGKHFSSNFKRQLSKYRLFIC